MEPLKFYKLKKSYERKLKKERTKLTSAENDIREHLFNIIAYINEFNRGVIPISHTSTESININSINNATKMIYGEILPWEELQTEIIKNKNGGDVKISYDPRKVPDILNAMKPVIDKYRYESYNNTDKRKFNENILNKEFRSADEKPNKQVRKESLEDLDDVRKIL